VRIGLNELNIKRGVVYSTIALSASQILAMEKKVSKIINANVTLTNKLDQSIIGGFKIQVEDYILDDSIKNQLYKLKESIILKKGENE
jgi:F-type H+-transporting ATPase subunit delta